MVTQEITSSTLSIRLSSRTKSNLAELARATKRTSSYLASEAIEAFVTREIEIIDGINRGLTDMKAGRIVPHEDAMRELRSTIAQALAEKS